MKKIVVLLYFVTSAFLSAIAQSTEVTIGGDVAKPFIITAVSFAEMKQVSLKVKSNDGKEHEYTGIALFDILTKAQTVPNNQLRGNSLTKYVLVSAADGYQVVIALPEIDPEFADQTVILANKQDGKDMAASYGPYRLIVPRDKKPARSAMRVISIDVLTAKKP